MRQIVFGLRFLILAWVSCLVGGQGGQAEVLPYQTIGANHVLLEKDKALESKRPDGSLEVIRALEDRVTVEYGPDGILEASGRFVIEMTQTNGVHFRFPKRFPSLSQESRRVREEPFLFTRQGGDKFNAKNWVAFQGNEVRIRGFASAESILPASGSNPKMLVSLSGNTSETTLHSDLRSFLRFSADPFPFWRAAREDLEAEIRSLRKLKVSDDRTGAEAYRSSQREMLRVLEKVREGYQLLQRNLYSQKVIDRMLQEGVAIPRLTLAEATLVRGDEAFSVRPFVNWRGEGRVLVDRARLKIEGATQTAQPPSFFQIEDLSNKMLEDTRVVMAGENSAVEVRKPTGPAWNKRAPIQFDLDTVRGLSSRDGVFHLSTDADATGFFLRKEIQSTGKIHLSDADLARDKFTVHYSPRSEDPKAAAEYRKFSDLKRLLLYPDPEGRGRLMPALVQAPEMVDLIQEALDTLAAAVHESKTEEVVGIQMELLQMNATQWVVSLKAENSRGETLSSSVKQEIPGSRSIEEAWSRIEAGSGKGAWLDFDGGLQ
jgi:hypothetical protein